MSRRNVEPVPLVKRGGEVFQRLRCAECGKGFQRSLTRGKRPERCPKRLAKPAKARRPARRAA